MLAFAPLCIFCRASFANKSRNDNCNLLFILIAPYYCGSASFKIVVCTFSVLKNLRFTFRLQCFLIFIFKVQSPCLFAWIVIFFNQLKFYTSTTHYVFNKEKLLRTWTEFKNSNKAHFNWNRQRNIHVYLDVKKSRRFRPTQRDHRSNLSLKRRFRHTDQTKGNLGPVCKVNMPMESHQTTNKRTNRQTEMETKCPR